MTREEAIKILIEWKDESIDQMIERTIQEWDEYDKKFYQAYDMAIEALQTKSTGEWLKRWGEVECSRCGEFEKKKSNFCPTCGAKMVERG